MKIIHVIPNIERGGAERAMIIMARETALRGHHVRIVVLGNKNAYADALPKIIPVNMLGYSLSYRKIYDSIRCIRRLRAIIEEFEPDIVHSHLWPAARMAGWALRQAYCPHVVHVQDTMSWLRAKDFRSRMMRFLTRTALRKSNVYYVAVGKTVAQYTQASFPWIGGKVEVIPNCFDDRLFEESPIFKEKPGDGVLTFGTAARLVPNKGVDRCLLALARSKIQVPWRYLVAGDGSERRSWESLAGELGLGDRVRFLGMVADMPSFYRQVDVYVQPSLAMEGLPLALAEAMACGVPVVATDVGSTRELVRHAVDGLIVPPDDVVGLAGALEALANNQDLRLKMARSAYERAWSEFSSTQMVERVMRFYDQVLEHKRRLN